MSFHNIYSDLLFLVRLWLYFIIGVPAPEPIHWLRGKVPIVVPNSAGLKGHMAKIKWRLRAMEARMNHIDKRQESLEGRKSRWEPIAEARTNLRLTEIPSKYSFRQLGYLRYEQLAIVHEQIAIDGEIQAMRAELSAIEAGMWSIPGI